MPEKNDDEARVRVVQHLSEMYRKEKTPEGRQVVLEATTKITGAVSEDDKTAVVKKLIESLAPKDEEKTSP